MPRVGSSSRSNLRTGGEPLGENDFLLVAAGEVHDAVERRRLHTKAIDVGRDVGGFARPADKPRVERALETGEAGVGGDAHREHEAVGVSDPSGREGGEAGAVTAAAGDAKSTRFPSRISCPVARPACRPNIVSSSSCATGADETEDAEHLPGAG